MKIPFTLDAWLKDKIQRVETRDGRTARIICTDAKADDGACVIALITDDSGEEAYQFFPDGRAFSSKSSIEDCADLFIITPEPEMTAFEKKVYAYCDGKTVGEELIKRIAKELLSLAREQFIKDGYVIEKKAFHDAVENISDKHRAEMSVQYSIHCKVEDGTRHAIMNWYTFQKVAQKFINIGKAEALKDLPRWKKAKEYKKLGPNDYYFTLDDNGKCAPYWGTEIEEGQYYITESDLEKLQKED